MNVPPSEMRLETELLLLQVMLAILGVLAVGASFQARSVFHVAAGLAWGLVAAGGVVWAKLLDHFVGGDLPPNSAFACLLEHRSAHTHTMLTNGPLLFAAVLALEALWGIRARAWRGE